MIMTQFMYILLHWYKGNTKCHLYIVLTFVLPLCWCNNCKRP